MKYINEEIEENEGTINGIDGFCENPRYENCYIYYGMMPTAKCWIFTENNEVEIHNVIVYKNSDRHSGYGRYMISQIRAAFPDKTIWVNSWDCSRGFWEKMVEEGYIDEIENEYDWPCSNSSCMTCHPIRNDNRRRSYF